MVYNIWAIDDSTSVGNVENGERDRKINKNKNIKMQRTGEEEGEIIKKESLQSEKDREIRVCEMATGAVTSYLLNY